MTVKDFIALRKDHIYYSLVSYDLAHNPCSTQLYRGDQVPNKFYNSVVTGFAIIKYDTLELHTDLIGDPFHN